MDPIVVIGGGIAGTSCVQTLATRLPDRQICLISSSASLKVTQNVRRLGLCMEQFDVEHVAGCGWANERWPNVEMLHDQVVEIIAEQKIVVLRSATRLRYDRLCICTGARPKQLHELPEMVDKMNDDKKRAYVLTLRDDQSVEQLVDRLTDCRRVLLLGNGGIATELAYSVQGCELVWAIRDRSITSTFLDPAAALFFQSTFAAINSNARNEPISDTQTNQILTGSHSLSEDARKKESKTTRYRWTSDNHQDDIPLAAALGPDWLDNRLLVGCDSSHRKLTLLTQTQLQDLLLPDELLPFERKKNEDDWPIYARLSDQLIGCDLILCAIGVQPNTEAIGNKFLLTNPEEGGFWVDDELRTSLREVFAAGDCCTPLHAITHATEMTFLNQKLDQLKSIVASSNVSVQLNLDMTGRAIQSPLWHQKRLWSQARQTGCYAGHSIACELLNESPALYACFDLFTHVTTFFGFKVILIGCHEGHQLRSSTDDSTTSYEVQVRVQEGQEFMKLIFQRDRLQGCILIGETDLEETFENLIHNQLDLSAIKDDLILKTVDIEDYFD